ncbi:MAG: hypothetical protein E7520_01030 [Ruminococcaceae bacterium]|nr:hypothetical protein [Oscillospiraceae bacterium]
MKKARVFVAVLMLALVMSGCSMRISSSIDDLISPISPMGDNADIKEAMDAFAVKGYSLKTPNKGNYITAYNFVDLDGDGADEAVAFYEPSDNLGTVCMAVIKKSDDEWKVLESIKGLGADVSSLDFQDVTGDGRNEFIVCWDTITNSSNHELAVYSYNPDATEKRLRRFYSGVTVNNYIAVDMTGDRCKELLLFELNSGIYSRAKAELYSLRDKNVRLLGETKLDAHITSYVSLRVEETDGGRRVYADALGTNGASMLTELIYWSDTYNTIISPFYSYSTGVTSGTTRSIPISSRDINGDKRIEIPRDKELDKLPKAVSCTEWRVYKNTTLIHTDYSVSPKDDGYLVIIPDRYIDDIRVKYDAKQREMTVISKKDKKPAFTVRTVLKANYSRSKYSGYEIMAEDKGYCYLAKVGDSKEMKITTDELKSLINIK